MANAQDIALIDSHVHIWSPESAPTAGAIMEACNNVAMNLANIPHHRDDSIVENIQSLLIKLMYPGRVYASGGLYHNVKGLQFEETDFAAQAKRLIAAGCDGIKMLEGKPTYYKLVSLPLNSPLYDEYYAYMQAQALPILFHVADPETFWHADLCPPKFIEQGWLYDDGTFPEKEELYAQVDDVLERYGDLRIILAHFYFLSADIERTRRFLSAHRSVKFDITPGCEMYENFAAARDDYRELFTEYAGQIVFGTDHILTPDADWQGEMARGTAQMRRFLQTDDRFEHWGYELHGLALPIEALEKIYHANFVELYGQAPKPVNVPAAVELAERLIADLQRSNADQKLVALASDILSQIKTFS